MPPSSNLHKPALSEVEGFIKEIKYSRVPGTNMTTAVGITVTGHPMPPVYSCCAMDADYDKALGNEACRKKVIDQTFDYYIAHLRSIDYIAEAFN